MYKFEKLDCRKRSNSLRKEEQGKGSQSQAFGPTSVLSNTHREFLS